MDKIRKLIDSLLKEHFGEILPEIKKGAAIVSQDFVSRGLPNSTACTSGLLEVYYKEFSERLERVMSFIRERELILDWSYLETKLHELANQIYIKAKGEASMHLVNAGLPSEIASFSKSVDKKKQEMHDTISNKIQLISMLRPSVAEKEEDNRKFWIRCFAAVLSFLKSHLIWDAVVATLISAAILWIVSRL